MKCEGLPKKGSLCWSLSWETPLVRWNVKKEEVTKKGDANFLKRKKIIYKSKVLLFFHEELKFLLGSNQRLHLYILPFLLLFISLAFWLVDFLDFILVSNLLILNFVADILLEAAWIKLVNFLWAYSMNIDFSMAFNGC